MKITVLSDNIGCGELRGEWGLSLYVEFNGKHILLDTGASDTFIDNAQKMGIDLSIVDFVVLSHAHFDHTRGLGAFLEKNVKAPVYLSPYAGDNCYAGYRFLSKYIGMPKGLTEQYPDRIVRPKGVAQISDGVFLVPHSTDGLSRCGRQNHLYVRRGFRYFPDDFSHEQTLVFKTSEGLVLMNSCSHSGPEVIVNEVLEALPGEHIVAYIGGLHLFRLNGKDIKRVSDHLASCGIEMIYTGHCTGQKAFDILHERFGDKIAQFYCGMEIDTKICANGLHAAD